MTKHQVSKETINKYVSKVVHSMDRESLLLSLMSRHNIMTRNNQFASMSRKELATRYLRELTPEQKTRLYVNSLRMKGEEIPYWVYDV